MFLSYNTPGQHTQLVWERIQTDFDFIVPSDYSVFVVSDEIAVRHTTLSDGVVEVCQPVVRRCLLVCLGRKSWREQMRPKTNAPPDKCVPGQMRPQTNASPDKCSPDKCVPGQMLPRTNASPGYLLIVKVVHPDICSPPLLL